MIVEFEVQTSDMYMSAVYLTVPMIIFVYNHFFRCSMDEEIVCHNMAIGVILHSPFDFCIDFAVQNKIH